jgi:TolA-binding protein
VTAIQELWLASCAGAVVFFVAGILVMSIRHRDRIAPGVVRAGPDLADGALAQAELTGIGRKLAAAEAAPPKPTAEVERVAERLREAERVLGERTAQLREAGTQLAQLKTRIDDAEAMRTEYLRLRTHANEMEFLTKEVDRLHHELQAARSIALGGTPRPTRPTRTVRPAPGGATNGATRSITDALASAIERFRGPQMRSIAIADKLGFPVSSYGDHGVELAAYAALLSDAAGRANQFLPVAVPASIEVLDEHGARVTVWPFNLGDDRLMLVNLSVGTTEASRVDVMLDDVIAILGPAAAPRGKTA